MFNSNAIPYSIAVAPVNGNNGGFGGDNGWEWLILLALLFGWGGNGNGFGGGFGGGRCYEPCATQADVRAAVDQQTLISKLDQQTYGLADSTYALNNTLNSNFRSVDNAICTLGYQNQQGFNALGSQLAMCCCDIERGIDGVNYNMAKNTCDITNTIQNTTRDIIDNANCNTRSILDFLVKDKIETLQSENQALRLKASQVEQNQYLINEIKPCPIPAYITCNPYASAYGFGLNNGCGCGCGNY